MAVADDVRPGQPPHGRSKVACAPVRGQRLCESVCDSRERRNRCSPRQTFKNGRSATVYARTRHRTACSLGSGRSRSVPRGSRSRRDYCRGVAPTSHPSSDPRITRPPSDGGVTHPSRRGFSAVFRCSADRTGAGTATRGPTDRPTTADRHGTATRHAATDRPMFTGPRNGARQNRAEQNGGHE